MKKMASTDSIMERTLMMLSRDFEPTLGRETCVKFRALYSRAGIAGVRAVEVPIWDNSTAYFTKAQLQLFHFLKRYRFQKDVFSDKELLCQAKEKFLATQKRISEPLVNSELIHRVLQKARSLAKGILGEYSLEEHMAGCRFGRRACYGHAYAKSYLDLKCAGPITGSQDHITWFKGYLSSDPILADVIEKCAPVGGPIYQVCDTLNLSFVPKSWKSLRTIKPNTLLGSFYTYGLGRLLQERLLQEGLDINHLQEKHRRLVKVNSRTLKLATADLSAASDSITSELLRKVLPLPWYRAVMYGRNHHVSVDGTSYRMFSVATMGDGHTFPLQTLIFYCLLKAIAELVVRPAYVSVYGDDLIYPSWLHKYVVHVFPKLHLILNKEKTYVSTHFRESCGADCAHGVDVRPFSPEGEYLLLDQRRYAEFLYKLLNGLKRRWDPVEIPNTWDFLLCELILTQGEILQVPPSFPDGSGLKVDRIIDDYFYKPVSYARTTHTFVFTYLRNVSSVRVVKSQYPYYWEKMRSSCCEHVPSIYDSTTEILLWRKEQFSSVRSGISRSRKKRLVACTQQKSSSSIQRQTGSTSCWT